MLPAANRGAGGNICAPDVCLTLVGIVPVPIPYVNVALNMQAATFSAIVKFTMMPALNLASIIAMSMGDEPGTLHWTIKGPGTFTMGNPVVFVEKMPAINLTCLAAGNRMNAPMGAALIPSATNVMLTYAGQPAQAEGAREGVREVSVEEVLALLSPLEDSGPSGCPAVESALLGGGLGYIAIRVFSSDVPSRVYTAMRELGAGGMRALLVDLRDNPGGEMTSFVELAGDFLPPGSVIVTMTDAEGDETVYRSSQEDPYPVPLVILVNRSTASAAELFAGCLQSHGRAVIVGEATYGKGTGQMVKALPGGGLAYATVARYALPNGDLVQGAGVRPDK
jgi:carboxyl-terminal processing protease